MKTFGNVVGHTGHVRKRLFGLEPRQRPDVRSSTVMKTFGNVVGHTGQVRKRLFTLEPR